MCWAWTTAALKSVLPNGWMLDLLHQERTAGKCMLLDESPSHEKASDLVGNRQSKARRKNSACQPVFFGVFRHGERDADLPDASLTELGVEQSKQLANDCLNSMEASTTKTLRVITSPYMRCVDTSIEIVRCFEAAGWTCQLLFDEGFGEVYNEQGFQEQPASPRHLSYTELSGRVARDVSVHGVKEKPVKWGEPWTQAIARYQRRLLRWSKSSQLNTIVVAHAATVIAAVRLQMSKSRLHLATIPSCGGLVWETERDWDGTHRCTKIKARSFELDHPSPVLPTRSAEEEAEDFSPCSSNGLPAPVAQDSASRAIPPDRKSVV